MDFISNLVRFGNKSKNDLLKQQQQQQQQANNKTNNCDIYHEKQVKELCALHSLNNLFQERAFTKATLDDLCIQLSPQEFINPHRSVLGLGNYNINVIIKALQLKGFEAAWFDKRKPVTILNLSKIKGFILNVPSDYKIGGVIALPWRRKHWVAITKIHDLYYNLDSKLDEPECIGNEDELIKYLSEIVKSKDKEMFVIISKEVDQDLSWKNLPN